jgi:hypothetical protein
VTLRLELDEEAIDSLATAISERLQPPPAASPWMNFAALVEYTSIPEGTLRRITGQGRIPSHGGKSKVYHRDEVDQALLNYELRNPKPAHALQVGQGSLDPARDQQAPVRRGRHRHTRQDALHGAISPARGAAECSPSREKRLPAQMAERRFFRANEGKPTSGFEPLTLQYEGLLGRSPAAFHPYGPHANRNHDPRASRCRAGGRC